VLFAVTVSGILFRIVSVEYLRYPVTGWFFWASGTAFVCFGTLIFLDRDQRANGLLLVAFGILWQLPWVGPAGSGVIDFVPVWAIFPLELNIPSIVVSVVLLRFPERHLQKRYERISVTVMATWLLSSRAIRAVTWPCWATPKNVVEWPLWLVNCDLSESAFLAGYSGEFIFYTGLILLLALRILRTRGLDRRIYVPVHIASIVGALTAAALALSNLAFWSSDASLFGDLYPGLAVCIAIAVIPVMLFLGNIGRRLLQLRIGGMVAEINVARTPDDIQTALRRALGDPSLVVYVWSPEHEQYVDAKGRPVSGDNLLDRVMIDVTDPAGAARARIYADESVAHHPELLRAACDAGGLALQNSALQASLLATIELERSSRELSETLSHLLPTGLADRLRRDGLHIGQPELVETTVLMSDIRGYSGIAETIDPAQLAVQLNAHRRAMNDVIMNRAGIVMQYMGDAVFAVFGPTTSPGKHADQAFAAAQEMHVRQDQINEAWTSQGQPAFGMGIGLSTGQVAAVLLGSDERFEYTLVGDAVNLAQRLQDLARPAGTTIMSEATWDNLTELPAQYEQLQLQLVKGRQTPVTCYRVMMPANDLRVSSKATNTADTSEV
jgi:class 3 adenylate cyclase